MEERARISLYGGLGDDRIIAGAGDDIIYGEAGTDYLEGGLGNDAYIFKMGDGTDTINDADGYNTIAFGDGFLLENIKVYRTDWNDLTIMFDGCEDKLVIEGYFVSEENRNFSVEFADGNFYRYDSENNPIHQADKCEDDKALSAEVYEMVDDIDVAKDYNEYDCIL